MMPAIHIYQSETAPTNERWVAFFFNPERLPMIFSGPTKESVHKCTEKWWEKEKEKLSKVDGRRKV